MKKAVFYISLSLIVIYGIYLRYYELGTGSFWIDEGYSSIVSYFSSLNNFIPYLPTEKYDFSQYLFTFFQNISFNFLGISDFSARIPSFIFGVLNIIVFYIFSKELLKNNKYNGIGIIFMMFLFTFSTWQIIWSREARFYEFLSFIYLSSTYLLWKYNVDNDFKYFLWFLVFSLTGILFHPFCFGLIFIGFIIFTYKFFNERNTSNNKYFFGILGLIFILVLYGIIDLGFKYISSGNLDIIKSIPVVNSLQELNYTSYLLFYTKSIYSQLGIVLISYIFGIIYFIYNKKVTEFIIFGVLIIINIGFISYGYMAHTRYMFHIYSIITLIGGYSLITFCSYLIDNYESKYKKIIVTLIFILGFFGIYSTYNITLIPQRFYYIDYTSPKPNFKMAYNYLEQTDNNAYIVSGFPHICYWYNLKNSDKCRYGLKINLTGNKNLDKSLEKSKNESYTNIQLIDNLSDIKDIENYYFVIDDLTLKNALNKSLLNKIINDCDIFYKDIGNNEPSNFLGIWQCK